MFRHVERLIARLEGQALKEEADKFAGILYCVCQKPWHPAAVMVGCEVCEDWFHPRCVPAHNREQPRARRVRWPDLASKARLALRDEDVATLRRAIEPDGAIIAV